MVLGEAAGRSRKWIPCYVPMGTTLTGLGERAHLASTQIDLETHIKDVVNTILYERLSNVVLVGHSYGGMVVTGVADSIPGLIGQLIYFDAFLPVDGEGILQNEKGAPGMGLEKNGEGRYGSLF